MLKQEAYITEYNFPYNYVLTCFTYGMTILQIISQSQNYTSMFCQATKFTKDLVFTEKIARIIIGGVRVYVHAQNGATYSGGWDRTSDLEFPSPANIFSLRHRL